MFKVIRIPDDINLTVDSTLFTVDNDIITVDSTIYVSYQFSVPYRFFSSNIKFMIYDEFNDIEYNFELEAQDINSYMVFNFEFDFKDNKTYESKITDMNDKLIWRGKIFSTSQQDIQNYSLNINKNDRDV